ncbi:DNA topoisomerase 1 [Nymphon striatum]|nr:DNA topoisomerase 1 [Nymphon striatum]
MPVVVVESPAKAKTINKYLGSDYTVLASYGHVRDLPPKDGSVDPDNEFEMMWEIASDSKKHVKAIADALKEDNNLILATDPDREGEAISWHLEEALRKRKAIKKDTPVSRVVFNAITKTAVTEAMKNPRKVDQPLVDAYLARRALDYLVGFKLSPVLWRRLPGAKSAGRVQSVCLRLIVDREMEIEKFKNQEYWSVKAMLSNSRGQDYEARLTTLAGKKLDKFDIANDTAAELAVAAINSRDLKVTSVEAKPGSRNPSAPFMTSTLQQEASRKFGMGARQTMSAAQRLYEAGHITYMRTDGIDMAPEAITAARDAIKDKFGDQYVPAEPRMYKNKAKNAQEAHECVRPTDLAKGVEDLSIIDADQRKLYDLIYKRTIASQMAAAKLERTTVLIGSDDQQVELRASGQVMMFDGFLRVYEEGKDDAVIDDDDKSLPQINQGEDAPKKSVTPEQHFTQPPPRYTEATLVKRMEELGIGRPSTYASIVTTIQDRSYVIKDKNRLIPEDKGRLVTVFLSNFFSRYVEYDFTAALEEELDDVSAGERNYKNVLDRFWRDFSVAIAEALDLSITEVLEKLNDVLTPHIFPPNEEGTDPRLCPNCGEGRLSMRTARSGGAFIGCSRYPDCKYTRPFGPPNPELEASAIPPEGKLLGEDDGDNIWIHKGRFGPYAQRGEVTEENKKPNRQSIPKEWPPEDIDLPQAVRLLSLPRLIGTHPEDGVNVWANIGRYGPYIKHADTTSNRGGTNANLESLEEVFDVGMNRAVQLLAEKVASRGGRGAAAKTLRDLGDHPDDGGNISIMEGKYGAYVKWEKPCNSSSKNKPKAVPSAKRLPRKRLRRRKSPQRKRKLPLRKKRPLRNDQGIAGFAGDLLHLGGVTGFRKSRPALDQGAGISTFWRAGASSLIGNLGRRHSPTHPKRTDAQLQKAASGLNDHA